MVVLLALAALAVVVVSGLAMRRKGTMTGGQYALLLGGFLVVLAALVVLRLRGPHR